MGIRRGKVELFVLGQPQMDVEVIVAVAGGRCGGERVLTRERGRQLAGSVKRAWCVYPESDRV